MEAQNRHDGHHNITQHVPESIKNDPKTTPKQNFDQIIKKNLMFIKIVKNRRAAALARGLLIKIVVDQTCIEQDGGRVRLPPMFATPFRSHFQFHADIVQNKLEIMI